MEKQSFLLVEVSTALLLPKFMVEYIIQSRVWNILSSLGYGIGPCNNLDKSIIKFIIVIKIIIVIIVNFRCILYKTYKYVSTQSNFGITKIQNICVISYHNFIAIRY